MKTKEQILLALKAAREKRDVAQGHLNEANDKVDAIEQELMESMQADGLSQIKGAGLTVSIGRSIVPAGKDWTRFLAYVHRHKAYHLLERRIHTTAWREEVEKLKNKPVPGVEAFERVRLTVKPTD